MERKTTADELIAGLTEFAEALERGRLPPDCRVTRVRFSDYRCPLCGSGLLTDGRDYWCSFVGGRGVAACDYREHDDG